MDEGLDLWDAMTFLKLAYVMVSFCKCGSEAYGLITSNCSKALYCCATFIER
jgi:hypothetical protein